MRPSNRFAREVRREVEDDDDAEPEWIDFDPKQTSGAFFGRVMEDESKLREKVQKEKES